MRRVVADQPSVVALLSSVRSRTTRSSKARVRPPYMHPRLLIRSTSTHRSFFPTQPRTHNSSRSSSEPLDYMLPIPWVTATVCSGPSPTSCMAPLHIISD